MIVLIVIIGLSLLIFVHELGHFLVAKVFGIKVEEFGFGFPPRLFGKKIGETFYSLNLLPFGGFVKIYGEDGEVSVRSEAEKFSQASLPPDYNRSFTCQPIWKRSATILAGVFMNILFGWFLLTVVFIAGSPEHLMISDVVAGSPAAIAGVKKGDVVFEARYSDIIIKDPVSSENFIEFAKNLRGKEIKLTIRRGKDVLPIFLTGRLNPPAGQGSLGISLIEIGFPPTSFFKAVSKGLVTTMQTIKLIVWGFVNFFLKVFVSPEILESVAGPVGIFLVARDAGSLGFIYLLQLIAMISLNLAVLNLIPFPALDGGRFLFLIIEKIKGSPISRKFERTVNVVGFVFLIVLMIAVTIKDIGRIAQ